MKYDNSATIIIVGVLLLSVNACKVSQPEFRRVENYQFNRDGVNFSLGADVVCYNPNRFRFKIQNLNANVFINDRKVTTIGNEIELSVKGKSEFSVPLALTFTGNEAIMSIFTNLNQILKRQEVSLLILGNVKFKAYGVVRKELPFRYEKKIDLSPFK